MGKVANELQAIRRYARAGLENEGNRNSQLSSILMAAERAISALSVMVRCNSCPNLCVIAYADEIPYWRCEHCEKCIRDVTDDELTAVTEGQNDE